VTNLPGFASDSRRRIDSLSRLESLAGAHMSDQFQQKFVVENAQTFLCELSGDPSRRRDAFSVILGGVREGTDCSVSKLPPNVRTLARPRIVVTPFAALDAITSALSTRPPLVLHGKDFTRTLLRGSTRIPRSSEYSPVGAGITTTLGTHVHRHCWDGMGSRPE
jgi:hypothetical protein